MHDLSKQPKLPVMDDGNSLRLIRILHKVLQYFATFHDRMKVTPQECFSQHGINVDLCNQCSGFELHVIGSFAVKGEILDGIITGSRGEFPDEVYNPQPFELLIAMEQLHCNVQQRWDQCRNHTNGLLLFQLQKNSAMLTVLLLLSKCRQRNVPVIEPGNPDIVNFITQSAVVQGTKGCRGRGWFDNIAARPLSDLGLPFWVC
ncbi:hypothetical protein KIW84_070104 [Lathyrus oleraceus]|uniref:Uncharacterized protein n=1 Tax=Pisum sativum TaxID=3888 RepID=A0A9D4VET9_PEA|nr:hypothetical protein KIW84_070104 [Pisum sativum]